MSTKRITKFMLEASTLALMIAATPAMAQEADTEARLSTVTVSAQRIEEDQQKVPISITTIAGEKLDNLKAGGADIRFLSARVPSVIVESSFGRAFPRFYIRGIGNTDFDLNASQPVSLVYDDVPYENPILKGYPVFDIADIEVLRGPQGTLFGRNTPGGIVKFDSVKPSDELDGYARASYGRYSAVELEGAVGGQLIDGLSARVSGLYQRRDDFVDNGFTGEQDALEGYEEFTGRVQFLVSPFEDDSFTALLNLHGRSNTGNSRLFRANIIDVGQRGLGSNFDRNTVQFDGQSPFRQDAFGVTLKVTKEISDSLDLTYIFGREMANVDSRGDIDGGFGAAFLGAGNFGPGFIPFPSESSGKVNDLTQTTNEIRLAFDNGGKVRLQSGAFFFDENVTISSFSFDTLTPGQPVNGRAVRSNETDSFGIFASASVDVSDKMTLSGGLRYTEEDKDFVVERFIAPFGAGPLGPITGTVADEKISWDVSATYAATDDVNYYARIAKGFRGPSAQGRLVFGDTTSTADSETVTSYEAGVKSEFMENRVRLNTNVFYYALNNQQLTAVGGVANTVALFNADKGEGYGFEVDLEAVVTPNFLVTGGLSFNHTEIKDALLEVPACGAGCTILDPFRTTPNPFAADGDGLNEIANISGNSFPNAPKWIGNATARYAVPVQGGEFYAFTDWAYKGTTNFFLYESVEFGQKGYFEGGARVGYKSDRGYEVSVFSRNITDKDALTGGIDFNNLTGFVNEPRTFGIEFRVATQ